MHVEARQVHNVACKVRIGKYMKTHTFPGQPYTSNYLLADNLALSWRKSYHGRYFRKTIEIVLKFTTQFMLKYSTITFELPGHGFDFGPLCEDIL